MAFEKGRIEEVEIKLYIKTHWRLFEGHKLNNLLFSFYIYFILLLFSSFSSLLFKRIERERETGKRKKVHLK